jgi:hypothetical protein
MLNPVVLLPLPVALAVVALLALAAVRYTERWPTYPSPCTSQPRHRLADTPDPYRPRSWDQVTADLPTAEPIKYGLLDQQVPLAEVEEYLRNIGIADWSQPLTEFERRVGVLDFDTRDLTKVR